MNLCSSFVCFLLKKKDDYDAPSFFQNISPDLINRERQKKIKPRARKQFVKNHYYVIKFTHFIQ